MFPYRDDNPSQSFPIVTISLIAINVATFFYLAPRPDYEWIAWRYGLIPNEWHSINFITAMFLHGSFFHLAFNMWYLWLFGDNLEDRLGKILFLLFYLSGGIFAFLLHAATVHGEGRNIPSIGASGAISAVMGGYIVLFPYARIRMITVFFFQIIRFAWSAWIFLVFWFVQQLYFGFSSEAASGIAYWAHIGGFVFGFIIAAVVTMFPGRD